MSADPRTRSTTCGRFLSALVGLLVALAGPLERQADAGEGCLEGSEGCWIRKPGVLILAEYSTSMNEAFSVDLSRWEAVEAALIHLVITKGSYYDRNLLLGLMRFGHDPSLAQGTTSPGDNSVPELVDGQALDAYWYDPLSEYKNYGGCTCYVRRVTRAEPAASRRLAVTRWPLAACVVALALIVASCSGGPVDSAGSSTQGVESTSTGGVTTSTSAETSTTSTTTDATTVATGPDQLPCQPDPAAHQGIICLPKTGTACGPCDAACLNSPQADALAGDLWPPGLCCFTDGRSAICGPAVSDGQCCYVIAISGCGCDS